MASVDTVLYRCGEFMSSALLRNVSLGTIRWAPRSRSGVGFGEPA